MKLFTVIVLAVFSNAVVTAQELPTASGPTPDERVARIQAEEGYQRALVFINEDYPLFVEELIELTEIPAPPFMESERGAAYLRECTLGRGRRYFFNDSCRGQQKRTEPVGGDR